MGRDDELFLHVGCQGALDVFVLRPPVLVTLLSDLGLPLAQVVKGHWQAGKVKGPEAKKVTKKTQQNRLTLNGNCTTCYAFAHSTIQIGCGQCHTLKYAAYALKFEIVEIVEGRF